MKWGSVFACALLAGSAGSDPASDPAQIQRPAPLQPLPLTQLDERASSADLDNRTFTQTFGQPTTVSDVLLQLVRGTGLSVVPDPEAKGTFVGELKNVTVRQALDLILRPLGLGYSVDGSFVRVFRREPETRIFDINYLASERIGTARVGAADAGSGAAVSTTTRGDVFADLEHGLRSLVSAQATFNLDRKAGLLQVTDFPDRLDRISVYLDAVHDRVQRQAQIETRVLEVELSDEKATGIDWTAAAAQAVPPVSGQPSAARPAPRRSLTGLRVTDVARLLTALEAQGKVTTVASPRLLTLNNEPAIIRTDTLTLSVTPQISSDAAMILSITPVLTRPIVAESDMIARVADGETLVVSGLTRDRETRERKNVGLSGGWFGRSTVVTRRRIELVILLTPRVVNDASTP